MSIMKKTYSLFLIFALILTSSGVYFSSAPSASASGSTPELQLGDYETTDEVWDFLLGTEFPGAQGSFSRDVSASHSGGSSAKVFGDFNSGGSYVALERHLTKRILPVDGVSISFWVKTADAAAIYLVLVDGTNQSHSRKITLQNTTEWQQVTINSFNTGSEYSHWGGSNDGVWHPSLKKMTFKVARSGLKSGLKSGTVWFDDVRIKVNPPELAIVQTQVGNVFAGQSSAAFDILTSGDSVSWSTYDAWGEPAGSGSEPVSGGKLRLNVPTSENGYYKLQVSAHQSGSLLKSAETTFATVPAFNLNAVNESIFGVQTHFAHSWNREMIPLIKYAGAKSVRDSMFWSEIELQKGVYTFNPKFTLYMEGLAENSIDPLMTFAFSNKFYDNFQTPYTPAAHSAYANYTKALLNRFGPQIKWGEMWNEFNLSSFGGNGPAASRADVYFELLKAGYLAAKEVRPDLNVVGGATSGIPLEWLDDVFELGGLDYMDTLSVHPYRYPNTPEGMVAEIDDLNQLVRSHNNGQTIPIWLTEMGWPTQLDPLGVDELTQAAYLIRMYVHGIASGIEKIFWYDFMDDGTDKKYNEHNFGLIHNNGDALGAYTPKPGYVALATVARQLTGASLIKQETNNDIYHYTFQKNQKSVHVLWNGTNANTNLTLKTNHALTVTDMMGQTETYSPLDGEVYLTVSGEPLFIQGKINKVVQGGKYALSSTPYFTDEPVTVSLSVYKTSHHKPLQAHIQLQGSSQDITARTNGTYSAGLSGISEPGSYTATAQLKRSGKKIGALKTTVQIKQAEEIFAKHVLVGEQNMLEIMVINTMPVDRTISQIDFQLGDAIQSDAYQLTVPAQSYQMVQIPISSLPLKTLTPYKADVHLQDGKLLSVSGSFQNIAIESMTALTNRTIEVDGSLADVEDLTGINLFTEGNSRVTPHNGEADLSGMLWLTYDNDNLYLSARVRDDVFSQTKTGDGIWSGDSIQFAISAGTPGEAVEWYEYGMALTSNGPELYRWMAVSGVVTGPIENPQLAVTRDEASQNTIYQLALPWSELAPILPSDGLLSLSMLVNENDGNGRKGWLEWGGGIGSSKRSSLFKPIRFVQHIPVTGVELDQNELELTVGDEAVQLQATVLPANAVNKHIVWSTSDSNIVTVQDGLVTAIGPGTATVTVTTTDGAFTAVCEVTVQQIPVTGVELDQNELELTVGDEAVQLQANVLPANAVNKHVAWSTSDSNIVTVQDGLVTAIGPGTAMVTVTTTDGVFTAVCQVTVIEAEPLEELEKVPPIEEPIDEPGQEAPVDEEPIVVPVDEEPVGEKPDLEEPDANPPVSEETPGSMEEGEGAGEDSPESPTTS